MKIKVSYLVSYDYNLFLTSVKQLYDYVDKIVVAVDKERKTWSGNTFDIPESFFEEVKKYDVKNKIEFYFDTFYLSNLSPTENETRQRNMVLVKLGRGWKIQLDVDEYVYEFKTITKYLKKYWYLTLFPKMSPICLKGKLVTLFKKLPEGYIYIQNDEKFPFITNQNVNTFGRNNNKIKKIYTNINVIHQSWARTNDEIYMKITNWGHRDDFDTMKYFEFWKSLNSENYSDQKNIHPLYPETWDKLYFLESNSIDDFVMKYATINSQKLIYIEKKMMLKALLNKFRLYNTSIEDKRH